MAEKNYPDDADIKSIKTQIMGGREYVDMDAEYYDGENRTYYFDKSSNAFMVRRIDIIVGSYMKEETLSERLLDEIISEISLYNWRESGFSV